VCDGLMAAHRSVKSFHPSFDGRESITVHPTKTIAIVDDSQAPPPYPGCVRRSR
jgi:hypothetical protein